VAWGADEPLGHVHLALNGPLVGSHVRKASVAGCGHAGDRNNRPDPEKRSRLLRALFELAMPFGGVISGEHGIGTTKRKYFLEFEDPLKVDLMRRINMAVRSERDPQLRDDLLSTLP